MSSQPLSLLAFALMEYERRGWTMPAVHVRIYEWLERTDSSRTRVLEVFRGCGKSTILGVRAAHKLTLNPEHQLLVQGADDELTDDISRDTLAILRAHPRTQGMLMEPAGVRHWWTIKGYAANARTPQLRGRGILSRVTGNRADEIVNDDTEVSKNVETEEARTKLRKRLAEQSFILKPDGTKLWVGTPHAHDSIYDRLIKAGAEALVIPLFETQTRHEPSRDGPKRILPFAGEVGPDGAWVFEGIGEFARLLKDGVDYVVKSKAVHLAVPTEKLVDVCVGNAWPERFHRGEMEHRRRECETLNYWDAQYGLQAKPPGNVRLDPDRMPLYDVEPRFTRANKVPQCWLGGARIVGAALRWDPSSGKAKSDVSAVALVLQDENGARYWHRAQALTGEVAEFAADGKTIVGGQVMQLAALVRDFGLRRVTVETNGIGGFAPSVLKACLKQQGLPCAVKEAQATANKARRILEALEPLILSRMLWAHTSVADGPLFPQMRQWNPALTKQEDDYLDAGAGAVTEQPERLADASRNRSDVEREDWRPATGAYEVELEL